MLRLMLCDCIHLCCLLVVSGSGGVFWCAEWQWGQLPALGDNTLTPGCSTWWNIHRDLRGWSEERRGESQIVSSARIPSLHPHSHKIHNTVLGRLFSRWILNKAADYQLAIINKVKRLFYRINCFKQSTLVLKLKTRIWKYFRRS